MRPSFFPTRARLALYLVHASIHHSAIMYNIDSKNLSSTTNKVIRRNEYFRSLCNYFAVYSIFRNGTVQTIFMNGNAPSADFKDNGLVKLHSFSSRKSLQNRVHEYSTQYKGCKLNLIVKLIIC